MATPDALSYNKLEDDASYFYLSIFIVKAWLQPFYYCFILSVSLLMNPRKKQWSQTPSRRLRTTKKWPTHQFWPTQKRSSQNVRRIWSPVTFSSPITDKSFRCRRTFCRKRKRPKMSNFFIDEVFQIWCVQWVSKFYFFIKPSFKISCLLKVITLLFLLNFYVLKHT